MKTDNKQTTRELAIEWWENTIKDASVRVDWKTQLCFNYIGTDTDYTRLTNDQIEHIYLSEHPQPTDTGKEDDAMRMAYQAADMQDYENKTGQYADTVNTVSSEVGFTGGKWYAKGQNIYVTLDGERAQVASAFSPETMHSIREYNDKAPNNEAEANAQRIVQAVNNHDKLVSALKGLIIEATNSTKDIISFNGADDLDAAIDQAKALLTTINQTK